MAYIDIATFIREYEEKLERELLALARKAPDTSISMAALSIALEKAVIVELVRAILRAFDKRESIELLASRLSSLEREKSRDDIERILTKLVELESYQRELPKLIEVLRTTIDIELVKEVLEIVKRREENTLNEMKKLIDSLRLELGQS